MEELLTASQIARSQAISTDLVRRWMREGRLPYVPTPLGRLVRKEDAERMAAQRAARKRDR